MNRSIRVGEFVLVLALILVAFVAGSFTASFIAASQVESHIDATIANTVQQQVKANTGSSAAAKKLFTEVDQICISLEKNPASGVHC